METPYLLFKGKKKINCQSKVTDNLFKIKMFILKQPRLYYRKVAFQTKLGSRPSCRDQEGRRGSEEVVPEILGVPLQGDRDAGELCGGASRVPSTVSTSNS